MTNRFNEATSVSAGDNLVLYAGDSNRFRELAVSVLQQYMQDNLTFSDTGIQEYTQQLSEPTTTGFSVSITNGADNIWLILKPNGTYTGTIIFPAVANVVDNQQILVNCVDYAVTTLTRNGNGANIDGSIPTSLNVDSQHTFKYRAADNTWYKVA